MEGTGHEEEERHAEALFTSVRKMSVGHAEVWVCSRMEIQGQSLARTEDLSGRTEN